jgi:hypothetical protein
MTTAHCASLVLLLAACGSSSTLPSLTDRDDDTTHDSVSGDLDEDGGADGDAEVDGDGDTAPDSDGNDGSQEPTARQARFRTLSPARYLSVRDGLIDAQPESAGASETFSLQDLNGAPLEHGDAIVLSVGGRFLSALAGGGSMLTQTDARGANETFTLRRIAGEGTVHTADRVALETSSGTHYVSAREGGGAAVTAEAPWARAWESFVIDLVGEPAPPVGDAAAAKQRILDYFADISGNRALAGIENKFNDRPRGHTDEVATIAGRTPSFWGIDFGFGSAVDQRAQIVEEAKRQWQAGAIVSFMYHTCVPTRDEYCGWDDIGGAHPVHLTDDQWDDLFTEGTAIHAEWVRRLDLLAGHFQELKDAGIAPLFRPFHEVNQCAFWWSCTDRENGTVKLWNFTRDYLENTKGLDNIIWTWNIQDFTSLDSDVGTYSPGPERFDLATLDIYNTGYTTQNYDTMLRVAGGKPIGIGECQFLPSTSLLAAQPDWTFFMLWPDFIREPRNLELYTPLFADERVLTLDEMPGW